MILRRLSKTDFAQESDKKFSESLKFFKLCLEKEYSVEIDSYPSKFSYLNLAWIHNAVAYLQLEKYTEFLDHMEGLMEQIARMVPPAHTLRSGKYYKNIPTILSKQQLV